MTSVIALLKILAQLFLLMLGGFVLRKANIVKSDGRKLITDLVMDFFLPCSIFKSFIGALDSTSLGDMINIVLISLGISVLGIILGYIFRAKNPDGTKDNGSNAVIRYGLICSNVTFMGSPFLNAIFGAPGLVLWAVYMIPYRIVMWTYGTGMFTRPKGKDILKKFLLSPCIIATVLGIVFMFLHITLPDFLTKALTSSGNCVTGCSMVVIGGLIAESKLSEVFSKFSIGSSAVRLVVMPLIVFFVAMALKLDPLVIGVSTALAGMPYATTTAMFAEKYDANTKLAAQIIFVTTLFSAVTLTLVMMLFAYFFPGVIVA